VCHVFEAFRQLSTGYLSNKATKLNKVILLINTIVCLSALETPVERHIHRVETALAETLAKNILWQKVIAEAKESQQASKFNKNVRCVAVEKTPP
jgi:hypothetical protein